MFHPIQIGQRQNHSYAGRGEGTLSLDQIVAFQVDEPAQKSCIYKVTTLASLEEKSKTDKYIQIRVKSTEFLNEQSFAIYFYDISHHIESIKLETEMKTRKDEISTSQMIVSHEFRTPLSASLMFLESLLSRACLDASARQVCILIISQINLLLSLVNDMLDMRLIEEGKFSVKMCSFDVFDLFQFIQSIFEPELKVRNNRLIVPQNQSDYLPKILIGDQIRLKQVLINLTKNAIKFTRNGQIKISASFDFKQG